MTVTGANSPWPFGPVDDELGPRCPRRWGNGVWCGAVHDKVRAARLGVGPKQLYRWRENGLTWVAADRVAIRLGVHPVLLWPEWVDVYAELEEAI